MHIRVCLILLVLSTLVGRVAFGGEKRKPYEAEARWLISRLSLEDFHEREAAMEELMDLVVNPDVKIGPVVRRQLGKTEDPEVRVRLQRLARCLLPERMDLDKKEAYRIKNNEVVELLKAAGAKK